MPRGSSPKRERQYEEILKSERKRGVSKKRAEEIAARTVNKARARSGEARTASKLSKTDISSRSARDTGVRTAEAVERATSSTKRPRIATSAAGRA